MYSPLSNEIFHVHTWRCKHAGTEREYEYVEKAIELGADRIVFTDHCPFPGNPFNGRMDIGQLDGYVLTLEQLKREYAKEIDVQIGLEAEYLPSFENYYKSLRESKAFDLLIIGQHFYEHDNGQWSFLDEDKSDEYLGLCKAMVNGAKSGYFDVIAHPDRVFRRCKKWNEGMLQAGGEVVCAALENNLYLERNYSSMKRKHQYWNEFWDIKPMGKWLYGYDAHSVGELEFDNSKESDIIEEQ